MKIPKVDNNVRVEYFITFLKNHFTPACYTSLFVESTYTSNCVQLLISKLLGLGIFIGGGIVKLPQLIKIIRAKSVKGISFMSYLMETIAYFIVVIYNLNGGYSITTWGEAGLILIQNLMVLWLFIIWDYKKSHLIIIIMKYITFILLYAFCSSFPPGLLETLMLSTIPILLFSRIPQIIMLYTTKKVGQLSTFTTLAYCLGTGARVFTTLKEVDDIIVLLGNTTAFLMNLIVMAMVWWYGRVKDTKGKLM